MEGKEKSLDVDKKSNSQFEKRVRIYFPCKNGQPSLGIQFDATVRSLWHAYENKIKKWGLKKILLSGYI